MNTVIKEYYPEGENRISARKVASDLITTIKEGKKYHLKACYLGFMKEVFYYLKDMN